MNFIMYTLHIVDHRPPVLNEISLLKPEVYVFLVAMTCLGVAYALFFLVFEVAFRNRK